MRSVRYLLLLLTIFMVGCSGNATKAGTHGSSLPTATTTATNRRIPFRLESPAFGNGDSIPAKFASCGHPNVSPPMKWSKAPEGTTSFALCAMDEVYKVWENVPKGASFVHWAIFNIPASRTNLEENIPKTAHLPDGILQGKNWEHKWGYSGPCPPPGQKHVYSFTIDTLDEKLDVLPEDGRDLCFALGGLRPVKPLPGEMEKIRNLASALEGHVLASATLRGVYGGR